MWFDSDFSFSKHMQNVCKSCFVQLRDFRNIRQFLTHDAAVSVANAFAISRLDYCNSHFRSLSKFNLHRLQSIQNSAARIVTNSSKFTRITPVLRKLHWLPVQFRSEFKLATLAHSLATAVNALSLPWEDLDAYAFPPAAILGKVVDKLQDSMQKNHSDCSGVAQHALVLGSSDHVLSDPTEPALLAQPVNTALQSDPSQKSDKPKSAFMAPRATSIKEQVFSEAAAARIEAPQRGSTRLAYEAKWTFFYKVVCH